MLGGRGGQERKENYEAGKTDFVLPSVIFCHFVMLTVLHTKNISKHSMQSIWYETLNISAVGEITKLTWKLSLSRLNSAEV